MNEEELENSRHQTQLENLQLFYEEGLIPTEAEYRDYVALSEQQHQERMTSIRRAGEDKYDYLLRESWLKRGSFVAGQLVAMTAGIAQHSRAAFELNKIASIAQAALNIPEAASNAYTWGTKIGGPGFGAAMATIATGAQILNMAAIKDVSFQGGGGGTTPSSAGSPVVNDYPTSATPTAASATNAGAVQLFIIGAGTTNLQDADAVADMLRDLFNERGTIIINSDSPQAIELVTAAQALTT